LPYYAYVLLAQYPFIRSVIGAGVYVLLFATYLGLLVTNFVMLFCSGRPPLDRWLKVTVLVLRLPPQHLPKVMGLRIK